MDRQARIHIVHILYSFGIGGLETGITNLVNRMDPNIFSHTICIFSNQLQSLRKIKTDTINCVVIKRAFRHDPTVIFRLIKLLRKERPDIVRTYNWSGIEGVIAALLSNIKTIIHSEHGFNLEEIYKQKRRRILTRRFLLKYCKRVIVVSITLQKWLVKVVKIDKDKVIYIPNGCDAQKFQLGKELEKKKELGIKEDDMVIGTVGALTELKDQQTLIMAFAKLTKLYNNLKLMLVGEGPLKNKLISLTEEKNIKEKVIFAGRVMDTAPFYRIMDIFVLPSLSENFPNALLEAMATGLPIIATDVGDVRLMLDGENGGIIIKPRDIDAIADGIVFFLKNLTEAKQKGAYCRRRVEEFFNFDKIVKLYEELYLKTTMKGEDSWV